jgi:integrase
VRKVVNEQLVKQLLEQIQQSTQEPRDIGKVNIINTMLWMKNNAYEPTTIKRVAKELRHLERNCNISIPEEVKAFIANKQCSNARKENLIESYAIVIKSLKLSWNQPFYKRYDKKRRAPKEQLLDFMINHFRLEMSLKLSMMKDLGTRPIELIWLKICDIDLSTGTVSITGAKHTIGREQKLKAKSIELLKTYIKKKQLNNNDKLFNISTSDYFGDDYRHSRNRLADDYNMPELKQICLYDFRRFKGTRVYHLTNGKVLEVKQALGHKDLRSVEKYITLDANITWIPVKCTTDEEIQQAIKDDCILVGHENGVWYFKKPA